ncbi:MAG: hypothetical protein IPP72_17705 [Chitinophagaceae bacterium]|nr:hypothetical protein [Chitinophagaceae bacterium]
MPEELDMNEELPFSSGAGWLEMKALLDSNLPVKKSATPMGLTHCMITALMFAILLFSSLHLGEGLSTLRVEANSPTVSPESSAGIISIAPGRNNYSISKSNSSTTMLEKIDKAFLTSNGDSPFETAGEANAVSISRLNENSSIQHTFNDIPESKGRAGIVKSISLNNQPYFSITTALTRRGQQATTWEVAAGIGINMAAGKQQHLQPYPVAEVKYNLNAKFYVAGGLSVFSPAPATVAGVTKTVYVNDTANNIRLYNDVVNYNQLRYVDLPLSVGVNISRKISFQTGLQASFLLSKTGKKTKESYDFQMNNVNFPVNPIAGMAANPGQDFNVQVRNVDYRFVAGIKYKQGKMSAGLTYQHGLQSPGMGMNTSKERNQFFTLNLLYNIK